MKKTDLAYIAGIVDGEGCICLTKRKDSSHKRGYYYCVEVKVVNTQQWLIEYLHFNFGGGDITKNNNTKMKNAKPLWQWHISLRKATEFLKLILPYLHLKRAQAELCIAYHERQQKHHWGGGNPKTKKVIALEEADAILMHKLNKRGIE